MNRTPVAERELTAEQALQRIQTELSRLALELDTRTLGQDIVCTQVNLRCPRTHRQARGCGKGSPEQARLGALYEALEHYWTDEPANEKLHTVDTQYFAQTALFSDDITQQLSVTHQHFDIACRHYSDPLATTEFSYPIALTSPHYPDPTLKHDITGYRVLQRYASNSGTAIGATYNEALLHATNECIERDAVSLFLLKHFYDQAPLPLQRIARPDDGDDLGRRWTECERAIGARIVLLDISNEFKARTFLAFSTAPGLHVFGTGCSLDPRHGAWRALSELVQAHLGAAEPEYQRYVNHAQRHLRRFPRLLRCQQFNTQVLLQRAPQEDEVVLPGTFDETPLAEQIEQLAEDLRHHGRTLGVTTLKQTALGTTLVNVVIPGLERFFVVSSGNVVIPQARGQALRRQRQGALT